MNKFNDILQTLIDTNNKLLKGEIKVEVAKQIGINTQVLINGAKMQLEYVKEIAKTPIISETQTIFNELKQIAAEAAALNTEENFDEEVKDKSPFPFGGN